MSATLSGKILMFRYLNPREGTETSILESNAFASLFRYHTLREGTETQPARRPLRVISGSDTLLPARGRKRLKSTAIVVF